MVLKSAQDDKDFLDTYSRYQATLDGLQRSSAELQLVIASLKAYPLYATVLSPQEQSAVDSMNAKAVDIVPDPGVFFPPISPPIKVGI